MTTGKEYKNFIYDKFVSYYNYEGFTTTLDDEIIGLESGKPIPIDISVRGHLTTGEKVLYIVQCKDHEVIADLKIIGKFSSVIQDVGASKGYLVCSSEFAKTIQTYARKKAIELVTLEDINSDKWKAEVEIPLIHINNQLRYRLHFAMYEDAWVDNLLGLKNISLDNGKTATNLVDYVNQRLKERNIVLTDSSNYNLDFNSPGLSYKYKNVWYDLEMSLESITLKTYFLKYYKAIEYSQKADHLEKRTEPLAIAFELADLINLDESFIEIVINDPPFSKAVLMANETILANLPQTFIKTQSGVIDKFDRMEQGGVIIHASKQTS